MQVKQASEAVRATQIQAEADSVGSTSTQCTVLDFNENGLSLQLIKPSETGFRKGSNVKVYFYAVVESKKEYFKIDTQVDRVVEGGIGLAFDNISESMFNALKHPSNIGSITAHSNNPRLCLTSTNHGHFNLAFKYMLNKKLVSLMEHFFNDAEDELEKPFKHARDFKDVTAHGNLAFALRLNRNKLIAEYCRLASADIAVTGDSGRQTAGLDASAYDLSLLEKADYDGDATFSALVTAINAQYKSQLRQLELKLSYVAGFPRHLIKNPIPPDVLCEHFREAIAGIEDSVAVKITLYKAFQTTLSNRLSDLYDAFDALMVEHGAPNGIAQNITWKSDFPTCTKPQTTFPEEISSDQQLPSFNNEIFYYPDAYNAAATQAQPQRLPQQPVSQTASILFDLINENLVSNNIIQAGLGKQGKPTTRQPGVTGSQEYSNDELLTALFKLQVSNAFKQPSQNSASLLQMGLSEYLTPPGDVGAKDLSSKDKAMLDVYDQLFQALLNELAITPTIISYLERIKLPLMALTLFDPNFLNSNDHPAGNLLNQLFSLESAVNQDKAVKNTTIRQVLDNLVSGIGQGFATNPETFAKANETLKKFSTPIAKSRELNARRVISIYEGKQRLGKARQKVQCAIDKRIAGKEVARVIPLLLDSGWQHLLVLAELNDGADQQRYLEVLDELLTWYSDLDKHTVERSAYIEMELDYINNMLGTICTNAFTQGKIIEELNASLVGTGSPRTRTPIGKVLVEPKAANTKKEFISDSWLLKVDQLNVGGWFMFSLGKEIFEPLNLVWIGEFPPVYVFVNRDGHKKQELCPKELAERLQSGTVAQIGNLDEPLMDRATTAMLQQMQEKLIHSVTHDPLTDLPNRKRFINLLKEQLANQHGAHMLCYLEIQDVRVITNVCGLVGGDQLLLHVSKQITDKLGNDTIMSRLGDKTFGFLLKNTSFDDGQETAKTIRDSINKSSFVWDDKSYTISVCIGLVPIVEGIAQDAEELMQKGDSVTISAKRSGHNTIRVYQENDEALKLQTNIHEWAGRIDRIFAENRLFARCQMIARIDSGNNNLSHYEILLGVLDEDGNIIVPDKFIPAVERCQRMPEIDRWVVEHVFTWIIENRACFDKISGFAINLSGQSLNSEDFLAFLKDRLSRQDVPTEKITFEITETVAAGSFAFTKRFIDEVKQFGCKFSLDDFGTGYSSYAYLKRLDVDYLKIDGSFIKDIANSPTDRVMVNSMNVIARSLGLETVAEYVEDMKIHAILKEIGVDYAQGYGIHKPMRLVELGGMLLH